MSICTPEVYIKIKAFQLQVFHSPDLAQSNYYPFALKKLHLGSKHFVTDADAACADAALICYNQPRVPGGNIDNRFSFRM